MPQKGQKRMNNCSSGHACCNSGHDCCNCGECRLQQDEEIKEKKGFVIDTDQKAEWALKKIAEIEREHNRLTKVCDEQISFYNAQKTGYETSRNNERINLILLLEQYFQIVKPKEAKTQASYKLPSGKLIKKFDKLELVYDPDKLLEALKDTTFVESKLILKWGEYKKTLTILEGDKVVNEDGEIIDYVRIEIKSGKFDVEM